MKLHLPLKLRAALAACLSAVSPFVPTVASGSLAVGAAVFALAAAQQAQAVTYAGTIYTVTAGSSSTDLAYASYYVTEQDAAGTTFTEDEENYVSGWNSASGGGDSSSTTVLSIVATDGTANTLRFTSSSGSGFVYTFRPLCAAGLIVEADSSVSSIAASGSNLRSFYLGDSDTETESFSTIDADFTISTGSYSGTTFTIRGTNTITVADGKTLTLTCSTNAVSQTDSLTLDGAGTVAVTNGLDIDGAVSLDAGALTVGGALNTGADSSINVAADASLTVTGMATLEGTLTSSGTLALNGGASFSNSVTVTGGTISITGELALSEAIGCSGGAVDLSGVTVLDVSGLTAEESGSGVYTYTLVSLSGSGTLTGLEVESLEITGINPNGKEWSFDSTAGTLSYTMIVGELTYSGGGTDLGRGRERL